MASSHIIYILQIRTDNFGLLSTDPDVSIMENILSMLLPMWLQQLPSDLQCLWISKSELIPSVWAISFSFLWPKENEVIFKSWYFVTVFIQRGQLQLLVKFSRRILRHKLPFQHFCSHTFSDIFTCLRKLQLWKQI